MNNKLKQTQKQGFKIYHQHVDFVNLLQLSNDNVVDKIDKEVNENLFLEKKNEINDIYKRNKANSESTEEYLINNLVETETLYSHLVNQLDTLFLDEKEQTIAEYIIGSLDKNGYFKLDINIAINEILLNSNIECSKEEFIIILKKIQTLDPIGVCARSLQECLLLQLKNKIKNKNVVLAIEILENFWDYFSKCLFDKIKKSLHLKTEEIENVQQLIKTLNPTPGSIFNNNKNIEILSPDFVVTNNDGVLDVKLKHNFFKKINIRNYENEEKYQEKYSYREKYTDFIKKKKERAKEFLNMLQKREESLLNVMKTIVDLQHQYFLSGEINDLKPMKLDEISSKINLDISIVHRIVNNKVVETSFGIFPLKNLFSNGLKTNNGDFISSKIIKEKIKSIIEKNEKKMSDQKITDVLKAEGIKIARRTVTKYRNQLSLPISRLRKN